MKQMHLLIHRPQINQNKIISNYTFQDVVYTHEFIFESNIPNDDQIVTIMSQWMSIINAVYLFSIEYFDQLTTDFSLSSSEITFFEKVINNGMAEFRYMNHIPIEFSTKIYPTEISDIKTTNSKELNGRLLLNGGGKDGLTSGILLDRAGLDYDLFQIGTGKAQSRTAEALKKKSIIFIRRMDKRRDKQKYSGHCPTSAAIAISAVLNAYLLGKSHVISSNENSANEANLEINGIKINHQYTKSYEFEQDFSNLLNDKNIQIKYFSLLRPIHELQIIKIFSKSPKYASNFVSCNHGFRKGFWCKKCAKCAFINLAFNAISPDFADEIFVTKNSINIVEMHDHILSLINTNIEKPLECVGTLQECQMAAKMISENQNITLNNELKNIMIENSKNINNQDIEKFIKHIQPDHNVPAEYDSLLAIMQSILND